MIYDFNPDVMKAREITKMVSDAADKVAGRAGEGFVTHVSTAGSRSRAYVRADSASAWRRARRDHALINAIGQGL